MRFGWHGRWGDFPRTVPCGEKTYDKEKERRSSKLKQTGKKKNGGNDRQKTTFHADPRIF